MNGHDLSQNVTRQMAPSRTPSGSASTQSRFSQGVQSSAAATCRPLLYRVAGLAREAGVDALAVARAIRAGRIQARRLGKMLVIHRKEAQRWLEELAK